MIKNNEELKAFVAQKIVLQSKIGRPNTATEQALTYAVNEIGRSEAELLAKDAEIKTLEKYLDTKESVNRMWEEEIKHIKSITVEDIMQKIINRQNLLTYQDIEYIAKAIHNLINGGDNDTA